jgi:hypothetical protein
MKTLITRILLKGMKSQHPPIGVFRPDLYALFLDYNGGVRTVENNIILDAPL